MSNLLKRFSVIDKDERVIDYNAIIQEKIDAKRNTFSAAGGFTSGLVATEVEPLLDEDGNPIDMSFFGMQMEGSDSEGMAAMPSGSESEEELERLREKADLEAAMAKAEEIINDARNQAESIIADAKTEAENLQQEAYDSGYNQGMQDADNSIQTAIDNAKAEYTAMENSLKEEYETMKASLEPELVEVITEVFSKVTNVVAEDNKDIILNLINSVLRNAEITNSFVIKASPEDAKFLMQNQGKIYCAMGKDIEMDIVEDPNLNVSQCVIEADSGIYDCSLDVTLSELVKQIKLLSCL